MGLNLENVEAAGGSLKPGKYPMRVTKVTEKRSQSGNYMWVAEMTIFKGTGKGFKRDYYFSIENATGLGFLKTFAISCGIVDLNDLEKDELLNKTFLGTLKEEKYTKDGEEKSGLKVSSFEALVEENDGDIPL